MSTSQHLNHGLLLRQKVQFRLPGLSLTAGNIINIGINSVFQARSQEKIFTEAVSWQFARASAIKGPACPGQCSHGKIFKFPAPKLLEMHHSFDKTGTYIPAVQDNFST